MPRYDYRCDANGEVVEVIHRISEKLKTWGEVCACAGLAPGDTPLDAPVERVITTPPMANTPVGNADLKNLGFTKLVKRDDGIYENVTRTGTEKRYMDASDPSSMPHLSKKISD